MLFAAEGYAVCVLLMFKIETILLLMLMFFSIFSGIGLLNTTVVVFVAVSLMPVCVGLLPS